MSELDAVEKELRAIASECARNGYDPAERLYDLADRLFSLTPAHHLALGLTGTRLKALIHAAGYVLENTEAKEYRYHREQLDPTAQLLDAALQTKKER